MIWIFGGTTEGKKCVEVLEHLRLPYVYSTKTKVKIELGKRGTYRFGAMTPNDMIRAFNEIGVTKVIDAAHPFALELHRNIFNVANILDVRLIRYEREYVSIEHTSVTYFDSIAEIVSALTTIDAKNVFVMTGVQNISKYIEAKIKSKLYYRIIDCQRSKLIAEQLGVAPSCLHLFPSKIDVGEQELLMEQLDIDIMITKESGSSGFFEEKLQVASKLGINLWVWKRPNLPSYDHLVTTNEKLLEQLI
ncbi:precorrin-6A/cobalt-precorrin-6A reductase [Halosquirtibacter xylanolyticus]|uniref:precorrin-6A/cobalt-precorrin-6A reductase n=1 Tax=Halosquirtibacter xylanolyticus TaxID=3374599 RepID=UPI003749EC9B|nr:precorrin-6A/cobalt-precorrin-6A reductase [Prolixibacteraceae bacterium]